MKIALAQLNTIVGDFVGNEEKIIAAYQKGVTSGADLVVCPELTIPGYPPRDLLLKPQFVESNLESLNRIAAQTSETGLIVGFVGHNRIHPGRESTNSVALLGNGSILTTRSKTLLPTYDVFDEDRYFEPATENIPVDFRGAKLGLTICEDVWNDEDFWRERRYRRNPAVELAANGANILFNISASPWHLGKNKTRFNMLSNLALKNRCPLVYCNLVGGNDELIFDGGSLVFNQEGQPLLQTRLFNEDWQMIDLSTAGPVKTVERTDEEILYDALVIGLRDYLYKCGFRSAIVGLSGGIDSALVACLASAALKPENVLGVSMPSQYSSEGSLTDARILAQNLGIRYELIPIQPSFETLKASLHPVFAGRPEDSTEENIQARIRGIILMALSNKFGSLVLTTGNKSEMAVGYCTLYGDMCGGLSVISDVPKTMVYRLAKWINREKDIIPDNSITKAPSAELRPNQTDQDSLPPYDLLDAVLEAYVVQGLSPQQIVAQGFDSVLVRKVVHLINQSEYKRRQAAPGLKVTSKAFGVGRRIPIAQRYRE